MREPHIVLFICRVMGLCVLDPFLEGFDVRRKTLTTTLLVCVCDSQARLISFRFSINTINKTVMDVGAYMATKIAWICEVSLTRFFQRSNLHEARLYITNLVSSSNVRVKKGQRRSDSNQTGPSSSHSQYYYQVVATHPPCHQEVPFWRQWNLRPEWLISCKWVKESLTKI